MQLLLGLLASVQLPRIQLVGGIEQARLRLEDVVDRHCRDIRRPRLQLADAGEEGCLLSAQRHHRRCAGQLIQLRQTCLVLPSLAAIELPGVGVVAQQDISADTEALAAQGLDTVQHALAGLGGNGQQIQQDTDQLASTS
ncbi:hypothetical protein D3C78_1220460 [compost metagenome]